MTNATSLDPAQGPGTTRLPASPVPLAPGPGGRTRPPGSDARWRRPRRWRRAWGLALCSLVGLAAPSRAARYETRANVMVEIPLRAARPHADPFNELTVDAVFTEPGGATERVPAFWAGGELWKVRYASATYGRHPFRTECSDASDTGLHGITGEVEITPYHGRNPLYQHGPLRVAADHRHLESADGTPFFWLGDTWWMGLCHRLEWPEEFQTLTADRRAKGFTVVFTDNASGSTRTLTVAAGGGVRLAP